MSKVRRGSMIFLNICSGTPVINSDIFLCHQIKTFTYYITLNNFLALQAVECEEVSKTKNLIIYD